MKILFLNQTFHPDVVATAQYLADLAPTLVERGHEVTVVCSRRAYDDPSQRYPRRETWRGVAIRRIGCFGFGKKARWKRAATFASYIVNCALHLAVLPRYDVVVGMTSPPLISWLGALFTRIKGGSGRFVFWVMDLNPDEALAAGWLRRGSLTTRVLKRILESSLHQSAAVVALDRFMAARLEAKGVSADKIAVLPPWSHDDVVRYDARGREQFRQQHGLGDGFVVMYSGNHTPCHPLATLLDAAERLWERKDIKFCFVGGGSELKTVRQFAATRQIQNIVVVPYQPLEALSASLSAADLHTVVMGDAFVGIVHPSKVYNIRALGIPYLYIGPAESHVTDLGPTFSARHGEVDLVVRYVQEAAADALAVGRARRTLPVANRQGLVGRMATILESAACDAKTVGVSRAVSSEVGS